MKVRKTQHLKSPVKLKTPTVDPEETKQARKPRQVRQASDSLAKIIRWVNLVPKRVELNEKLVELVGRGPEAEALLLDEIDSLPPEMNELRLHLRKVFKAEVWRNSARLDTNPDHEGYVRVLRIDRTLERYADIRNARNKFRALLDALETLQVMHQYRIPESFLPEGGVVVCDGGSTVTVSKEYIVDVRRDLFGEAIQGVDIRNIRECPVCSRIFFARRVDSVVCDPNSSCEATYSKRQERKNAKLRAEIAERSTIKKKESKRKTKRADPATKR